MVGVLTCVIGLASGGCRDRNANDTSSNLREDTPLTEGGTPRAGRDLTPTERDTLLAIKDRLHITRDEYWDNWGGILANDWAEFRYPTGKLTVGFAMHAFEAVAKARRHARAVFGDVPDERVTVRCTESMSAFRTETGHRWWNYGVIDGNTIVLQPIPVIYQRGLMGIAPAREYYRWVIRTVSGGRVPRWMEYGLASVVAGEDDVLRDQAGEFGKKPAPRNVSAINHGLKQASDRLRFRRAHYGAFRMCRRIVARHGIAAVVAALRDIGSGSSFDDASRRDLNGSWGDVVREAKRWGVGGDK